MESWSKNVRCQEIKQRSSAIREFQMQHGKASSLLLLSLKELKERVILKTLGSRVCEFLCNMEQVLTKTILCTYSLFVDLSFVPVQISFPFGTSLHSLLLTATSAYIEKLYQESILCIYNLLKQQMATKTTVL